MPNPTNAGVARGLVQVTAPYALLISVAAAVGAYAFGAAHAPTLPAHHSLPGWFTPFFSATVGVTAALMVGLIVPSYDDLRVWTVALAFLWMAAGVVACILALAEAPSRSLYPQIFAVTSAGLASGIITAVIVVVRSASGRKRRLRRERLDGLRT